MQLTIHLPQTLYNLKYPLYTHDINFTSKEVARNRVKQKQLSQ